MRNHCTDLRCPCSMTVGIALHTHLLKEGLIMMASGHLQPASELAEAGAGPALFSEAEQSSLPSAGQRPRPWPRAPRHRLQTLQCS